MSSGEESNEEEDFSLNAMIKRPLQHEDSERKPVGFFTVWHPQQAGAYLTSRDMEFVDEVHDINDIVPQRPRRKRRTHEQLRLETEEQRLRRPELADQQCAKCFTYVSPEWRRGPDGTLLCNRCGLRYRKQVNGTRQAMSLRKILNPS